MNIGMAYSRLRGCIRARRDSGCVSTSTVFWVLLLELAASIFFLLFVIDGPGLEHTHPALFPWAVDRLLLSLFFECHMLSTFVLSAHLRFALPNAISPTPSPYTQQIHGFTARPTIGQAVANVGWHSKERARF